MSPKIPNILDRKHFLNSLPELFEKLSVPELASIANSLGLSEIINDGTIIPRYSVDVSSNTDRFLNPEVTYNDILLTARLYHFLNEVTDQEGDLTWKRYVNGNLDPNWSENGSVIQISQNDLQGILDGEVRFVCTATIEDEDPVEDFYFFTYTQVLSKVRIVPEVTTFVNATPNTNTLRLELSGINPTAYRWYLNTEFVSAANTYVLNNSSVPAAGAVTVRVEVVDTKGNEHYDFITITKVRNGNDGQQGPQGPAGDPGQDGQDGSPGVPGTDAPILRMLEWVNGRSYFNNSQYKDYVYYRPRNKWFKLIEGTLSAVATGDPATQSSTWEETTEVQGSILAENANIGGWIMRNNMLFSQAGLVLDTEGLPLYSNIILNGLNGQINLGNNRGTLDQEGLTFRDSEQRPRIVMHWDDGSGTPILRFLNADGTIKWEAGQQGYIVITEGTQPLSWGPAKGFRRITSLANDSNLDFDNTSLGGNHDTARDFIKTFLSSQPNTTGDLGVDLPSSSAAYLILEAFPNTVRYDVNLNRGRAYQLNKGDMASNADKHEGFYTETSPVTTSQLPSSNLLPDGWYFAEGVSGGNGQMLPAAMDETNPDVIHYNCIIGYFRNGVRIRTVPIRVHTKTQ